MNSPLHHAGLAALYIVAIVSLMWSASYVFGEPDNIFMPMGMLALLVLSVSVMAYLFFYRPVVMILEGRHAEAATFFLHTVGIFAVFTFAILTVAALVSRMM